MKHIAIENKKMVKETAKHVNRWKRCNNAALRCKTNLHNLKCLLETSFIGATIVFLLKVFPVILLWIALLLPQPCTAILMWGTLLAVIILAPEEAPISTL